MRIGLIWMITFLLPLAVQSQQWAGPDVEVCEQGTPKTLGSMDPCPGCCYNWTPAEGLSCTTCKNPEVNVKKKTDYTVEVRDQHLKSLGKDMVTVDVAFGNIHFTPDHLIQGSDKTVEAKLLSLSSNFNPSDIHWSLVGGDLGCMNTPIGQTSTITPGDQYGKVHVLADYMGDYDGECYAKEDLDINNGVKDVWAIDYNSPTRMAKNDETLYTLNEAPVLISAKPNEGGFKNGVPDWKPDAYGSHTPPQGAHDIEMSEDPQVLDGRTSQYIAGELPDGQPKVTVIRRIPLPEYTTSISMPGMDTLDKLIKKNFKFFNKTDVILPCGTSSPFTMSLTLPSLGIKVNESEKYNSPFLGIKQNLAIEASVSATGKLFHPTFTHLIDVHLFGYDLVMCSRLYTELTGVLMVNMEFNQNDSLPDDSWIASDPSLTASLGISGNLEFAVIPVGYLISASAKLGGKLNMIFTYVQASNKLIDQLNIDPITANLQAKIQQEGDMGKYEDVLDGLLNFSKQIVLMDKKELGPWDLYQF